MITAKDCRNWVLVVENERKWLVVGNSGCSGSFLCSSSSVTVSTQVSRFLLLGLSLSQLCAGCINLEGAQKGKSLQLGSKTVVGWQ